MPSPMARGEVVADKLTVSGTATFSGGTTVTGQTVTGGTYVGATLTAPAINGTVTTTGLTLPAFTATGAVVINSGTTTPLTVTDTTNTSTTFGISNTKAAGQGDAYFLISHATNGNSAGLQLGINGVAKWVIGLGITTVDTTGAILRVRNEGGGVNIANFAATGIHVGATAVARGTTEPTNAISLYDGTAPAGTLANGVSLYSAGGKLFAMDAGGTPTQLTP